MNYIINYLSNPLPLVLIINILNGLLVFLLVKIFKRINLPNYLILTLLIGFVSALGEIIFSIYILRNGLSDLFFGFIIGVYLLVILGVGGISIIINKGLPTKLYIQKRVISTFNISVACFVLTATDGYINVFEGALLLFLFFALVFETVNAKSNTEFDVLSQIKNKKEFYKFILAAFITFVLIVFISEISAYNLSIIFSEYRLHLYFVGMVVLAPLFATPELFYELYFNKRNFRKLNFGDLLISGLSSLIFTTGLLSMFFEIKTSELVLLNSNLLIIVITLIIFNLYAYTEKYLRKLEGIILFLFLVITFIINFYFIIL